MAAAPRRDACRPEVVQVFGNYQAEGCDGKICVDADATITLPKNPEHGDVILVIGDGGTATVTGGVFPLVGGDFSVPDGFSVDFVFACSDRWIPKCCPPPPS